MTALTQHDRDLLAIRNYRDILQHELDARCARKELYSMRAFARDLEVPVSCLSSVLSRKSHFSKSNIYKISFNLQKPEPVESYFLNLALSEIEAPGDPYHPNYLTARKVREEHLFLKAEVPHRMLNSWSLKPLILKLILGIEGEIKTNEALQKRLGVSEKDLQQMLDDLQSIGWIERSADGHDSKLRFVEIGDAGNAYDIRELHKKGMHHALKCLETHTADERHFYSAFFTMSPDDSAKVAKQLKALARNLAESQEESVLGHEAYVMGTFLVPLTHPDSRDQRVSLPTS
ncbi:MAG TPA: DUF4423 domain-containing protein [Oligoflexus sp.]|uniref:DUF4423 domain-containing protein n=1 Tax=Oligoflexus sp. TaxID=1971216 RepID=UPI002D7F460D|nr:DUF4423 domain-containing protein [Oligoflexus sp.]HET9236343.1 DUF4423 domain-containing protein [Oligoflexus sp.]